MAGLRTGKKVRKTGGKAVSSNVKGGKPGRTVKSKKPRSISKDSLRKAAPLKKTVKKKKHGISKVNKNKMSKAGKKSKKNVKKRASGKDKSGIWEFLRKYAILIALVAVLVVVGVLWSNHATEKDENVIEFNPRNMTLSENVSYYLEQTEQFNEQVAVCNQHIGIGDYDNAILCLKKADTIKTDPSIVGTLADILAMRGRDNESAVYYMQALEISPYDERMRYNYALVLERLNRTDDAIKQYKIAVDINPNHTKSWNNMGVLFQKQGNLTESSGAFFGALQTDENSSIAILNYANILAEAGDVEADEYYNKYIRLNPDDKKGYWNYARYLYFQGNYAEAKSNLEKTY